MRSCSSRARRPGSRSRAQNVPPNTKHDAYAVWLFNSRDRQPHPRLRQSGRRAQRRAPDRRARCRRTPVTSSSCWSRSRPRQNPQPARARSCSRARSRASRTPVQRSAADPLEPLERLVELALASPGAAGTRRCASSRAASGAARSSPACRRRRLEHDLGDRLVEHPLERRPDDLLLPARGADGGSDSSRWKSTRTGRPFLVTNTCVQRSSSTPSIRLTPGHQRGMWCGSSSTSQTRCWRRRDRPAC